MYQIVKRVFDFCASLLAIIVLSPLWLIAAIGIKASSPGPVLFRAERMGRDQRPFILYKFRSMHELRPDGDPESRKNEGRFIANAQRIFPFGAFLRKSKLDELPQLLNILRGEMSVIGPRPLSAAGVRLYYSGEYSCITEVKPGLACLDSLFDYAHGELFVGSNDEFREKVLPVRNELARMYVERKGVGLDLYCIFRTVLLILRIAILRQRDFPYTRYEAEARETVFDGAVAAR